MGKGHTHGHEHRHDRDELHDHMHEHLQDFGRAFRGGRGRWAAERGSWGGGRRMRRGDIRKAMLVALREGPANGYEIMRRLEEMSGGLWRPSPGSVYPHLQMLEDAGVVQSNEVDGSRTYTLTDSGREEAEQAAMPVQDGESEDQMRNLRMAAAQLMGAAKQLSGVGDGTQIERGIAVIQKARKELYQILAED